MKRKVQVIEPVSQRVMANLIPKKRVCAYCRVSTKANGQQESYKYQATYYEEYITSNPNYEYMGVYADKASGTKITSRLEFQRMLADCRLHKIDMIITKSITRFARNTVDCIRICRELRQLGIEIYFQNENINTLSEKSELMLTILSSLAQGTSETISTNQRWAIKKRFQDGTYKLGFLAYGYTKDVDGNLVIEPEEAKVIRRIFQEYLQGNGSYLIAKRLTKECVPRIKDVEQWHEGTVSGILHNPIYKGELLLQKTYTTESLPFVRKINDGRMPKYVIPDHHDAIVSPEQFDRVQKMMLYKRGVFKVDDSKKNLNTYEFTGKIKCSNCGTNYRRQKIHIGTPRERVQWTCYTHITNIEKCNMKAVKQEEIENAFLQMWNKLVSNVDEILEPLLASLSIANANSSNTEEVLQFNKEIDDLKKQSQVLAQVMAKGYMNSALFISQQNELDLKMEQYKAKRNVLLRNGLYNEEIANTKRLIQIIKYNPECMVQYDEQLFTHTIDHVLIEEDYSITFILINQLRLTESKEGNGDANTNVPRL